MILYGRRCASITCFPMFNLFPYLPFRRYTPLFICRHKISLKSSASNTGKHGGNGEFSQAKCFRFGFIKRCLVHAHLLAIHDEVIFSFLFSPSPPPLEITTHNYLSGSKSCTLGTEILLGMTFQPPTGCYLCTVHTSSCKSHVSASTSDASVPTVTLSSTVLGRF